MIVVGCLEQNRSIYPQSSVSDIEEWLFHAKNNSFISKNIEEAKLSLYVALLEFQKFISIYFDRFPSPTPIYETLALYPEGDRDRCTMINQPTQEKITKLQQLAKELFEITDNLKEKYSNYRKIINSELTIFP